MSQLHTIDINEVFSGANVDEYQKRFAALWNRLTIANASIFIVRKVLSFPYDELLGPIPRQIFWGLVVDNFIKQAATDIAGMFKSSGRQCLTFGTLKKWMEKHCKQHFKNTIENIPCSVFPGDPRYELIEKAWRFRSNFAAHINLESVQPHPIRPVLLTDEELDKLVIMANEYLSRFSIGAYHSMQYMDYERLSDFAPDGKRQCDIEEIFDALATSSVWLNMPEDQQEIFPYFAEAWLAKEKEIFNQWRPKIGKEPIDFDEVSRRHRAKYK